MTESAPAPFPLDPTTGLTWCVRCQVHHATQYKPLCPVCLDRETRAER